ncbi:hypothetical protein WMZ97_07940 [Lentibacillus sp. N15]|uniref:hypothetical protein n=1 Tax=Lentibacillus songyuanensis TaxID=3136161 RepID=UPI0031BB6102
MIQMTLFKLVKKNVGRKEIRNLIAKQTLFVFAFPLLVGIVHSLFIIKAFLRLLATLLDLI